MNTSKVPRRIAIVAIALLTAVGLFVPAANAATNSQSTSGWGTRTYVSVDYNVQYCGNYQMAQMTTARRQFYRNSDLRGVAYDYNRGGFGWTCSNGALNGGYVGPRNTSPNQIACFGCRGGDGVVTSWDWTPVYYESSFGYPYLTGNASFGSVGATITSHPTAYGVQQGTYCVNAFAVNAQNVGPYQC